MQKNCGYLEGLHKKETTIHLANVQDKLSYFGKSVLLEQSYPFIVLLVIEAEAGWSFSVGLWKNFIFSSLADVIRDTERLSHRQRQLLCLEINGVIISPSKLKR